MFLKKKMDPEKCRTCVVLLYVPGKPDLWSAIGTGGGHPYRGFVGRPGNPF